MLSSRETSFPIELPHAHTGDATVLLAASELRSLSERRFVGNIAYNPVRARFAIKSHMEGHIVSMSDQVLLFEASEPLELLYSVYEFAEECWGFCFFEPGNDILSPWSEDFVARNSPLMQSRRRLMKRCGFIQEFPFSDESLFLADWMAKNQLNYLLVWMKYYEEIPAETQAAFHARGIEIESGHHNFDFWIPAKTYARSHPEFFAMRDGKRMIPDQGADSLLMGEQLCTTNHALRDELTRRMQEYLRDHPELKTISLIPNDGFGWCECEACSKLYDAAITGDFYSVSAHVFKANRIYHNLISDISARLRASGSDVTLTLCAYVNYSAPAPKFRLSQGMTVHFAPYWRCVNHSLSDSACWLNSEYAQDLKAWIAVKDGGEVNIYDYLMGVNLYVSLPLILHESIFEEAAEHARIGVDGYLRAHDTVLNKMAQPPCAQTVLPMRENQSYSFDQMT